MIRDEAGLLLEHLECCAERSVAFFDGLVEAIMGGSLLGQLPDALDAVELGRVRRKPEQLDAVAILGQPLLSFLLEVVAGAVVDDQEDLASATGNDLLQEVEEREAVEDGCEAVVKLGLLLDGDHAEDVRGLAQTERIYAGLAANSGPRLVERSVEPEARFVAEGNDTTALSRFFLMRGSVSRSQVA